MVAFNQGDFGRAEMLCRELVVSDSSMALAWHLLGGVCSLGGREEEASGFLLQACEIEPCNVDFHLAYAGSLLRLGEINRAAGEYAKIAAAYPELQPAWYGRARALERLTNYTDSLSCYERACQLDKSDMQAYLGSGSVLIELGLKERAREKFEVVLHSGSFGYEANVGVGLTLMPERIDDAQRYFLRALEFQHEGGAALSALSVICKRQQNLQGALCYGERAVAVSSADSKVLYDFACLLRELGRGSEAATIMQQAYNQAPSDPQFLSGLLLTLHYFTSLSGKELFELHKLYSTQYESGGIESASPILFFNKHKAKIRLGFVSGDFCLHPVGLFLLPLLEELDRERFEVYLFSNTRQSDYISKRLLAVADFAVSILSMSDNDAVKYIREQNIDLLIDLAGHTPDNRLGVFARRGAPVQLSWLGYPDTTGLKNMDYRIVDSISDMGNSYTSEKLLCIEGGFLGYRGEEGVCRTTISPCVANKFITFGCFNNFAKLSAESYAAFAEILKKVDKSRLILKSGGLGENWVQEEVYKKFAEHGVKPERLILLGKTSNFIQHMESYARVDIALDTFPYNGTTTTCDALWMGVPVISWLGELHVSRVTGAILTHVGLTELVGADSREYVDIAVALANSPEKVVALREGMEAQITPLTDIISFARRFEKAILNTLEKNS